MSFLAKFAAVGLAALALGGCHQAPLHLSSPLPATPPHAKNVILFIGDGMSLATVTAARIYEAQQRGETGEESLLSFETLPHTALVKTYNTDAQVPDSAGTATAMNAGVKTRIGYVGIGEAATRGSCASSLAHRLPSTAQAAKRAGLQVGIVTTTRITHATPAAVFAHSVDRNWEADGDIPEAQRAAGCADIAAQLVAFPFDVALGGGRAKFMGGAHGGERLDGGADLSRAWAANTGGSYVETAAQLADTPPDRPVLGLFAHDHLAYTAERPANSTEPTLTAMTAQAITRLERGGRGFYLMVEAGRIDHAHHASRAGYALEDTVELARAVRYAIENTDPRETLILVTADHSHTMSISGYPRRGNPILGLVTSGGENGGAGAPQPALALDGKPYATLSYANGPGAIGAADEDGTNEGGRPVPQTGLAARQQALVPLASETHNGEDVALYAGGIGSEVVRGVMEQNRIAAIIQKALGLAEAQ